MGSDRRFSEITFVFGIRVGLTVAEWERGRDGLELEVVKPKGNGATGGLSAARERLTFRESLK